MSDDRPSSDSLEHRLHQELTAKAAAAEVTFDVDDVVRTAGTGPRAHDHRSRYYLALAAAAVVAIGVGGGIWGLLVRSAPISVDTAGSAEAAEGEPGRPVDVRVAALIERQALIASAPSAQSAPTLAAQWMAPDPLVIEVDGLGLVAIGTPDPEPQDSWEAEVTTDSRCVASLVGLACGPLLDDQGRPVTRSVGATHGSAGLAEDGRAVLVSTDGSSGAWLLATGLPDDVVLVEMTIGDATVGQIPVENTVALFHPLGVTEVDLVGLDAEAVSIWEMTFEPRYPLDGDQNDTEAPFADVDGTDGYDQAAVDATGFGSLVPPPERLGQAWSEFYLDSAEGLRLTAEPRDGCPNPTQDPPTIEAGVYIEYGVGPSPDDAVLVVVTDATTDLAAVYSSFEGLLCGTTPLAERPIPELPGAIKATRFLSEDDLGQVADGVIVLRDDIVLLISVGVMDGVEPVDVDILVAEMLEAYDTSR